MKEEEEVIADMKSRLVQFFFIIIHLKNFDEILNIYIKNYEESSTYFAVTKLKKVTK